MQDGSNQLGQQIKAPILPAKNDADTPCLPQSPCGPYQVGFPILREPQPLLSSITWRLLSAILKSGLCSPMDVSFLRCVQLLSEP